MIKTKCTTKEGVSYIGHHQTGSDEFVIYNDQPLAAVPDNISGTHLVASKCFIDDKEYKITNLGGYVFFDTCITEIILPSTITTLSAASLEGMKKLVQADISLLKIEILEGYTFADDSELKYVLLPPTLKEIQSHAFYRCTNLECISFPKGVNKINESAFEGANNLKIIIFCGYKDIKQPLPFSIESVYVTKSYHEEYFCQIPVKHDYEVCHKLQITYKYNFQQNWRKNHYIFIFILLQIS